MASGVPSVWEVPGVSVMPSSALPPRLRDASPGEVPGPWRTGAREKALVISLDEVVADRYDEGMQYKMLSIVSETLAFFS